MRRPHGLRDDLLGRPAVGAAAHDRGPARGRRPDGREASEFAALVRALVQVSSDAVDAGERAPEPPPEMLRAAYWLAARHGLGGRGLDVRTGRSASFGELAGELLAHVLPALRGTGDLAAVARGVRRLAAAAGRARSGSAPPTACAGG
ncbi:hypothetical protein ACFQY7_13785 [Actinomadura luteofluorescens]|uniref:hypothetical protein n=1 Tax=Actinomadura luteofluorescens TaxID=46163 RepID=UPI00363ACEA2